MKTKISPEDYNKIIKLISLEDITLIDCSFKLKELNLKGGTISLKVNEKCTMKDSEKDIIFYPSFSIEGFVNDETDKNSLFALKLKYIAAYSKNSSIAIGEDFLTIFKEISLSNIMWPYYRELTQSLISRATLPPITLPLRK